MLHGSFLVLATELQLQNSKFCNKSPVAVMWSSFLLVT